MEPYWLLVNDTREAMHVVLQGCRMGSQQHEPTVLLLLHTLSPLAPSIQQFRGLT
jgi:hypothetical protein